MDREADDEEGAEGQRAHGIGGADRQALAEVVQPDPDRDHQGEPEGARPGGAPPLDPRLEQAVDRRQREVRHRRPDEQQLDTAEGATRLLPDLNALESAVDHQKAEQPDRDRHEEPDPVVGDPAQHRDEQHPEGHRDDSDVDAQKAHQRVEAAPRVRRLNRGVDRVLDRRPGRGKHRDRVRAALLPRVVERELLLSEVTDLSIGLGGERDVPIVDRHLSDLHVIGPGVANRELDLAWMEHGALHSQVLDRRSSTLVETGASEGGEQDDRARDQHKRTGDQCPGGQSASGRWLDRSRLPSGARVP